MTSLDEAQRPLPKPNSLTAPFWEATREGRLTMQRCQDCSAYIWTPQPACTRCLSERLEWTDVSGRGTVYTYVVVHRAAIPAFKAPYTIAVIELEEGPRIFSDVVEIEPADVRIGMPVEVAFEQAGTVGLYHFRPASADGKA